MYHTMSLDDEENNDDDDVTLIKPKVRTLLIHILFSHIHKFGVSLIEHLVLAAEGQ